MRKLLGRNWIKKFRIALVVFTLYMFVWANPYLWVGIASQIGRYDKKADGFAKQRLISLLPGSLNAIMDELQSNYDPRETGTLYKVLTQAGTVGRDAAIARVEQNLKQKDDKKTVGSIGMLQQAYGDYRFLPFAVQLSQGSRGLSWRLASGLKWALVEQVPQPTIGDEQGLTPEFVHWYCGHWTPKGPFPRVRFREIKDTFTFSIDLPEYEARFVSSSSHDTEN